MSLNVGDTSTLTATVSPSDATDQTVTFSTSDSSIATVTPKLGKVTAIGAGSAKITATTEDGNKTAICTVTVSAPENSSEG